MEISQPYLLFLGDVGDQLAAKTALGIVDWRPEKCLGQFRLTGAKADTGLPDMTPAEAARAGARTMVIGAVNAGGHLPEKWISAIVDALDAGLDIAAGMHMRLSDLVPITQAAARGGRQLHDVRVPPDNLSVGTGAKRPGKRLLTVGTDCSVGKKYTSLALARDMQSAGLKADFRATGQTGILIAGAGVPIDAVVADFISGAAEALSPAGSDDHWDVIEGQGSVFHPSFAAVTLGLLHGSQPDALVLCHEPTRTTMRGVGHALPTIAQTIETTTRLARLTNPQARCVGLAVNTAALDEKAAQELLTKLEAEYDLPACDPIRTGTGRIVERLISEFGT
ncbi:MAG: N-acetyltransferase DgcN [Alphaproteobacteria bacterium]